ncbi:MAG: hypothetical protein AB7J32_20760 [Pseudonocardia sp.]
MCDGARYAFLVPGELTTTTAGAFPELTVAPGPVGGTVLFGYVRDQSHLHGLLVRFAELAIAVVEMRRLPD